VGRDGDRDGLTARDRVWAWTLVRNGALRAERLGRGKGKGGGGLAGRRRGWEGTA
jgi:hypothetical protein